MADRRSQSEAEHAMFNEVDRSRYRANWSCLIWFFLLGLIALTLVAVASYYYDLL